MKLNIEGGGSMEELIAPISNVGFPIVVSMYLLIRFEKKVENLNYSILNLINIIQKNIS